MRSMYGMYMKKVASITLIENEGCFDIQSCLISQHVSHKCFVCELLEYDSEAYPTILSTHLSYNLFKKCIENGKEVYVSGVRKISR